ncbi:hypothetical protein PI124_g16379 [Phytophthora idaei]|nr:hypothetical protein PI125_g14315 [Phytophthora idaei]KAG3141334.1 hypothetical protein PI126_g15536 [Phytophthora idaei]KAG3238672.1 hypothetical protein PI124_g16379 [Phytophthora idaei]
MLSEPPLALALALLLIVVVVVFTTCKPTRLFQDNFKVGPGNDQLFTDIIFPNEVNKKNLSSYLITEVRIFNKTTNLSVWCNNEIIEARPFDSKDPKSFTFQYNPKNGSLCPKRHTSLCVSTLLNRVYLQQWQGGIPMLQWTLVTSGP